MSLTHILYFLIVAMFWGGSFLAIHYVVASFPPAFGAFLRVLISFTAVSILMLFVRNVDTPRKIKLKAIGAGVFNFGIPWILLFYGEKFISPALASIYNSSSTIFAAVFTIYFLAHSKLSKRNLLGVVGGFLGVVIVFAPNISHSDANMISGQLAVIVMAVCYGIGVTWVKSFSHEIRATRSIFYQSIGGLIVLAAYSAMFEAPWMINFATIPIEAIASLFYLGICSTFVAWLLYLKLIRECGSVEATAVTYVVPFISIILDYIILGRLVSATDVVGAIIVLSSIWLIQKKQVSANV